MVLVCVGVKDLFIRVYKTINESQEKFPRRAMKHRIACPGLAPKTLRGEICEKAPLGHHSHGPGTLGYSLQKNDALFI